MMSFKMEKQHIENYKYLSQEQREIYNTRCPSCGHEEFHIVAGDAVVLWCDNCLTSIDNYGGII